MKTPHLLRVDLPAAAFAALFAAARDAGLRLGWLELRPPTLDELSPALECAAELGALRAVAVGGGRSVAVKPLRGEAVLRDVLREHFRGCAAVLVRGELDAELGAARLEPDGDAWRVVPDGGDSGDDGDEIVRRRAAAELVATLRKPRPW